MRSKTWCFNSTLFRKNLARFWPLWGGVSLVGSLAPLSLLVILFRERFEVSGLVPLDVTASLYWTLTTVVPVLSLVYAPLCALAVWHFLYGARSVSLLHALPITRKGIFLTNTLSGLAMMLIPYAVTGLLAGLVALCAGLLDPAGFAVTILGVLGYSLFYYGSATAVIFVTGNPFAFAALYGIFHFLALAVEWLVCLLMSSFYYGVEYLYRKVLAFLSPTVFFLENVTIDSTYTTVLENQAGEVWEHSVLSSVQLVNGWVIAVYALAGAALLACAWLLYRRRRSECAGDVVAVEWMKPVFRYGCALCAAMAGGLGLYTLFWSGFEETLVSDTVPMALCMAFAGVLGFYIASMLLAKSLRIFRSTWKGALGTVIAAAALCFLAAADPLGMETWTPDAGNVSSVYLRAHSNLYGNGLVIAEVSDPAAIARILALQEAIIHEREAFRRQNGDDRSFVSLIYYGPDGEELNRRYYSLSFPHSDLQRAGSVPQTLAELVTDPAIQEVNIFSNPEKGSLRGGHLSTLFSSGPDGLQAQETRELTIPEARTLEEAIRRDIQAGHFGKTLFLPSETDCSDLVYSGTPIVLYYSAPALDYEGNSYTRSWDMNLNLSVYCTETLQALEELGILSENSVLLTEREYSVYRDAQYGSQDGAAGWRYDREIVY